MGIFTAAVEILLWGAATKLAAAKENNPPGLASEAVGAVGLTVEICVDWATSAPPAIAAKYNGTTGINCPVSSTLESLDTQIILVLRGSISISSRANNGFQNLSKTTNSILISKTVSARLLC